VNAVMNLRVLAPQLVAETVVITVNTAMGVGLIWIV
jgi:hypothetical protein